MLRYLLGRGRWRRDKERKLCWRDSRHPRQGVSQPANGPATICQTIKADYTQELQRSIQSNFLCWYVPNMHTSEYHTANFDHNKKSPYAAIFPQGTVGNMNREFKVVNQTGILTTFTSFQIRGAYVYRLPNFEGDAQPFFAFRVFDTPVTDISLSKDELYRQLHL